MTDQKEPKLKTIRISYGIAEGDLTTRVRQATDLLQKGCRVRLEMRLKGRQNAHPDIALAKMLEVYQRLMEPKVDGKYVQERTPLVDGNNVVAQLRIQVR
jgi:translation initiation factor IF-3